MQQGGVRLSSNGLSSSGRCGVGDDFGTSDPQEPQEPVNFSAALLISVPSQWAIRGGRFLCGRMRGSTPASVESPKF